MAAHSNNPPLPDRCHLTTSNSLGAISMAMAASNSHGSAAMTHQISPESRSACSRASSIRSAPVHEANGSEPESSECASRQAPTRLSAPVANLLASDLRPSPANQWESQYLKISEPMAEEIYKWRRTMPILLLAFLYAVFAFGAAVFKPELDEPSRERPGFTPTDPWTQEMIAGWHRDRPLVLSSDGRPGLSNGTLTSRALGGGTVGLLMGGVRECRSRASQTHVQLMTSTSMRPSVVTSQSPATNKSSMVSGRPKILKPKRKFEALNGCLFRRDTKSDSMGDICCCAGIPRFVLEPVPSANSTLSLNSNSITSPKASNQTSTSRSPSLGITAAQAGDKTDATRPMMRRRYQKPQILCFISAAAYLFNAQRLVAPLVGDTNLRNSFVKGKGQCITCSCCHEHEPDRVNMLLANVPLEQLRHKSLMVDKNGNQLLTPASPTIMSQESGDESVDGASFWVKVRRLLVGCMRSLDEFFFWLYDLADLFSFTARYGILPANVTDYKGFTLAASSLVRPPSLQPMSVAPHKPKLGLKASKAPSLMIDADLYDDFTTTTTTTTTTSTTTSRRPTSGHKRRRKGKRRKTRRKKRRRQQVSSGNDTIPISTTTVKIAQPDGGDQSASNQTAAEGPTMIINVYTADTRPTSTTASPIVETTKL